MLKRPLLLFLCFILTGFSLLAQNWPADTVSAKINTGDPRYPFPQFKGYKYGTSLADKNAVGVTHADMEKTMREGYQIMMHRALYTGQKFNGKNYIVYNHPNVPANYGTFVSEGDGYVLLAAAYFADKEAFDGLWMWIHDNRLSKVKQYYKCQDLRGAYTYGASLPGWQCTETDGANATTVNTATDGDVDIAMALLIAYKQWGDNMGINDACGNPISYKKEALNMIKSMVDTLYYSTSPGGAQAGSKGYMTGDVGIDGYLKSGNTFGELTNWRNSAANTAFPWAKAIPDPLGAKSIYPDYMAPAYFNEFAKFLAENGGSKWQINQYKRVEASSDWVIRQMYNKGYIASTGNYTVNDDGSAVTLGTFSSGEDFRASWRTILNYVWHGNPDSTWNPVTHLVTKAPNTFEYDMGVRHANFLKYPGTLPSSPANAFCSKLGASPDPGQPSWKGVAQIKQNYAPNGTVNGNFGSNYSVGSGAPAAVASGDHELVAEIYRQSELVWDDAEAKSSGMTDSERYIKSTPKYFHDWFRLLGMLTTSGNLAAPAEMDTSANVKVYMSVDKTFGYEGDLLTYTVSYRNYGSITANNVSITTSLDNNYQFVSATNGGTAAGNSVTWNIGKINGFKTSTGVAGSQGFVKFSVRIKPLIAAVNTCLTSTITASNSLSWTSNEYPNNASYTMERNCVDLLKDRVLTMKKTADRKVMNGSDIANFKIDFENRSGSNLWLNGGRDKVVVSYANYHGTNGTSFYQFYRIWHTAHEAYINLGNYRVSYFMNDAAAIGLYNPTTNTTGWDTYVDNQSDLNKYGYNPLTLPVNQQMKFTYQKMPWGEDANGSWNQRIVTQFANVLTATSTHVYDKLDSDYLIHKGVTGPGFTRTRFESKPSTDLTNRLADDWSYSASAQNSSLDGQAQYFFPVSPGYTDFTTKFAPQIIDNYSKDACNGPVPTFSKVLVEEFDGYTWRRIAGNGPLPGRETYNVVILDSIPIELTFTAFTNSTTLGVTATYSPITHPKYSGVIKWTVPVMLTGEKGSLSYSATAKAITCPSSNKNFVNAAWISSQVDSPDSSAVPLTVTCSPVPPTPPLETSLKKTASKTNAMVGDPITYTLTFTNTDGSTALWNGTSTVASDWKAAGTGTTIPDINKALINLDQNPNTTKPGANGYAFEHIKVHGKNGWIETTVGTTNSSTLSYFFRHTAGTPGQADFQGIRLQMVPNDGGDNFISIIVYNNNTAIATYTNSNKLSFGGSPRPIKFRIELLNDKMYIWANDFTGAPLKVISGLTNLNPGFTGIFANGSQQTITAWKGHFDSAFDLVISDAVPAELTNIATISNSGTFNSGTGTITWPLIAGPILATDPPIIRTFNSTVSTCASYINNTGKASVYGITNIQSQNVVNCGSAPPTCVPPLTVSGNPSTNLVCENTPATLKASFTPGANTLNGYKFIWYKKGSTINLNKYKNTYSDSAFTSVLPADTGFYIFRVEDGTDGNLACYKETTVKLELVPLPSAPVTTNQNLCQGDAASPLMATGSNLKWYTAPIGGSGSSTTPVTNTSATGQFSYYVSQSTSGTPVCESPRATLNVTIKAIPVSSITTTGSALQYCQPTNGVSLTATPIQGATYQWYLNSNPLGTPSSSNILTNATVGDYTVKTIGSNSCSATSNPSVTVSIATNIEPALDIDAVTPVCENSSVNVKVLSQSNGTIEWFEDDVSKGISTLYTFTALNSVVIKAILTSSESCANPKTVSKSISISVDQIPSKADITSRPKPLLKACSTTVNLSSATPAIGTGVWSIIGSKGSISSTGVLSQIPDGVIIPVVYTVSNGLCSTSTDTIKVQKAALPSASNVHDQSKAYCNDNNFINPKLTGSAAQFELVSWENSTQSNASIDPASGQTDNIQYGDNKFYYRIRSLTCTSLYSLDSVIIHLDSLPAKPNAGADQEICTTSFPLNLKTSKETIKWSADKTGVTFDNETLYQTNANNLPVNTTTALIISATNGECQVPARDTINITSKGALTPANVRNQSDTVCFGTLPTLTGNSIKNDETQSWTSLTAGSIITSTGKITNLKTGINKFEYKIDGSTCPGSTKDTVTIYVINSASAQIIAPVSNNGTYKTPTTSVNLQALSDPLPGYKAKWEKSGQGVLTNQTGALNDITGLISDGTTKILWIMSENSNTCPPDTAVIYIEKVTGDYASAGTDTSVCENSLPLLKGTGSKDGIWKAVSSQTSITQNGNNALINTASSTQINLYSYCVTSLICDTIEIKVTSAQTPSLSINPFPSDLNCKGDSVVLIADQLFPATQGIFKYKWWKNGSALQNDTLASFGTTNWKDGDKFELHIKAIPGKTCLQTDTAVSEVILKSLPAVVPVVSIKSVSTNLNCESDPIRFSLKTRQGSGANPLFTWYLNNQISGNDSVLNLSSWKNTDKVSLKMKSSLQCATPQEVTSNILNLNGTTRINSSINLTISGIPDDRIVCPGTPLSLQAGSGLNGIIYQWTDGTTQINDPTFSKIMQSSGLFTITAKSKPGCYTSGDSLVEMQSINIDVSEPVSVKLIYDGIGACKDSIQTLNTTIQGIASSYKWYINDILQSGKNLSSENFTNLKHLDLVKVEAVPLLNCNNGILFTDTATVRVFDKPKGGFIGQNEFLYKCSPAPYTLFSNESNLSYQYVWTINNLTSAITGNSVKVLEDGIYQLEVSNNSCSTMSSTTAATVQPSVKISTDQTEFAEGETFEAEAKVSGINPNAVSYSWTPASVVNPANQSKTNLSPVETFYLKVKISTSDGCEATDSLLLKLKDQLFIPNALVSGENGINAFWGIKGTENYPDIDIKVFNRWGTLVHEQKGYSFPWDGTIKGKQLPSGTYYYVIKDPKMKNPIVGDLTIVR